MIDTFIKHTRASFNLEENELNKSYHKQFESFLQILSKIHPEVKIPKIKITYSLNRLSETFVFQNETYIIHDQYLGQSLNKMNRILYYEDQKESFAYLCKVLAEENYILNNIPKSIAYSLSYQVNSKAKAIDLPDEFKIKKNILINIQESFIFFHEYAHSVVSNDLNHLKHTEDFLSTDKSGILLIDLLKQTIKEQKLSKDKINFFYEEVACDFLAVNFTFAIFNRNFCIKATEIFTGITSAFLYLRTFYDLKNKAKNEEESIFTLFMKLRYNALRNYISIMYSNSDCDFDALLNVYELWEEKFEYNVMDKLDNELEQKLLNNLKDKINLNDINLAKRLIGLNN